MAELDEIKAKNQAFLLEQERLRMRKPSTLAIDLRNKVAGECQPYIFGGVTHYLDDRGYLLAKRLIERFDGRYTIGVYELVLKSIKTLSKAEPLPAITPNRAVISLEHDPVQMLAVDTVSRREALRILYTTEIEIRNGDILYHATTLDMSENALRVVMKRAYTLNKGDSVSISFSEFSLQTSSELFADIPHQIIGLEQDDRRSYLILKRLDGADPILVNWFEDWTKQHQPLARLNVDDQLLNLVHDYYLRLYHRVIKKPLLWLASLDHSDPIKTIHLSAESEPVLTHLRDRNGGITLEQLPITELISQPNSTYLVFIYANESGVNYLVVNAEQTEQLQLALSANAAQVIQLQSHAIHLSASHFERDLAALAEHDPKEAEHLRHSLSGVTHLISLSDITSSCQYFTHIVQTDTALKALEYRSTFSARQPTPTSLHRHIRRRDDRFLIRTDISLHLLNEYLTVSTNDVSELGLSIQLSGHFPVAEGTVLRINFLRWQTQTDQVKLTDVPYVVRRMQYWEGNTSLGLERNVMACGEKQNQFFAEVIEDNKDQLAIEHHDSFETQASKVFGDQLAKVLPNIPFYLALDKDKQRIIQAVASTEANQAAHVTPLWSRLNDYAAEMLDLVRVSVDDPSTSTGFGVYCYIDNAEQWHIEMDFQFSTAEQKQRFIHRALAAKQAHFYHCDLTALKQHSLLKEADLDQQLGRLRRHSPHHTKQIREATQTILAVGDLTDISAVIRVGASVQS